MATRDRADRVKPALRSLLHLPRNCHLFEFCDAPWTPRFFRKTLLEVLEYVNTRFVNYYQSLVEQIIEDAIKHNIEFIVELGAGTCAPLTKRLAKEPRADHLRLIPCDLYPDTAEYTVLENQYPEQVLAMLESVDFSHPHRWPSNTMVVLSTAFHHILPENRARVVANLTQSADRIMVFESVRKTTLSWMRAWLAIFPALLLPIGYWNKPGGFRRVLWCWILPVVPLMWLWDNIVGHLRLTTEKQWLELFDTKVDARYLPTISHTLFTQVVAWHGRRIPLPH